MSPTCAVAPAVTAMDIAVAAASSSAADDARRVRLAARFFLRALALSAVLHAATLVWLPGPRHAIMRAALPLMATLRLLPAAPPAASAAAADMPGLAPARASRSPAPVHPAPAPAAATSATLPAAGVQATAATAAPAAVPATAPAAAEPAPAGAVSSASAAADAASPSEPVAAARPPAPEAARLLDGYGRRLAELLSRQQQYPPLAAQRGWQGEVRLRVSVARKGAIVAVRLLRSSGFDLLDRHALAMIEQLRQLPAPPAELDAAEVQVVVPVQYRLRKPA